ncbi:hypothetical protein NB688_003211 [Xanthomonas sacchari]|uniref:Lipoprotein n=1 Tax=Xanthomonas sacchari TaxID=56458 RepID=A0ABT3DYD7_9XANT|nr:hypothetical protein [Xanthomonas sacchari]MCW0400478.1 hypothetical protein [Xanthomonas sacchari]MCW0421045.1 hypothetical protein [Xanthomonas sacchari]UYK72961.1 hypothetical protein NG828_01015 [Xanthomonas sacchari]
MTVPPRRPSLLHFLPFALLAGCTMTDPHISQAQFAQRVEALLGGRDNVVVTASQLTDFPWASLCFARDDSLRLTFKQDAGEQTLSLPYEQFFVDEAHVPQSLEDICVKPGERILIRKKYPGYAGPVEFLKPAEG